MNLMLENLNPEQKKAVETTQGPLLVLSGAGTGKTLVLVTRIAHIIASGLAQPWQVLALTFTNKAANEMKKRIGDMFAQIGSSFCYNDLWCGTFHSICLKILHINSKRLNLGSNFIIFGEDDQKSVLKNVITNLGFDPKHEEPAEWVEKISFIKDRGYQEKTGLAPRAQKIFDAYNDELKRLNALDFGDIILNVIKLFRDSPDVLKEYQKNFKYILVDEFQDTNTAQMQLLQLLTQGIESPNICCVGDDDQSIYSWRGAEIKNILNFEKNFPGAQIIRLETNYRSTSNILGAANSLIHHNQGRLGKDLHTADSNHIGEPVYVLTMPSNYEETDFIANTITRFARGDYSNFAVLIRSGSLSRQFEEKFTAVRIPYRLIGATKFYERTEIRDVIAYIRLLLHPGDDISFARIIGKPRRGFGPAALGKIRLNGTNFMDGLRNTPFGGKLAEAAKNFLDAFDFEWRTMPPADAAKTLLERTGYFNFWRESKTPEADERIANINELVGNVIPTYDTLDAFLEQAALMTTDDNDTPDDNKSSVTIMTIHAAKGLEFDTVFLPAWEESIFPNSKSFREGGLEEERRLAYVAITRAKRRAVITNAMSRVIFGERQYNPPSRFIAEMDPRFLDFGNSRPQINQPVSTPKPKAQISKVWVGKLVAHPELGRGVVIEENNGILTIAFNKIGIKKVEQSFVKIL